VEAIRDNEDELPFWLLAIGGYAIFWLLATLIFVDQINACYIAWLCPRLCVIQYIESILPK
jgi:hypothetical protein